MNDERYRTAGTVTYAALSRVPPPFIRKRKYTGRRAEGVRYERKVQVHLMYEFPDMYIPSPWLNFKSAEVNRLRWCQPDGLIVDLPRGVVTCVEIKYSHTSDAWWQTRKLYIPVLQRIFPSSLWAVQVCEVVKWYDPAVHFPEKVELASEPHRPSKLFKVHICRP